MNEEYQTLRNFQSRLRAPGMAQHRHRYRYQGVCSRRGGQRIQAALPHVPMTRSLPLGWVAPVVVVVVREVAEEDLDAAGGGALHLVLLARLGRLGGLLLAEAEAEALLLLDLGLLLAEEGDGTQARGRGSGLAGRLLRLDGDGGLGGEEGGHGAGRVR